MSEEKSLYMTSSKFRDEYLDLGQRELHTAEVRNLYASLELLRLENRDPGLVRQLLIKG
jgi:hypothetical protein